MENKERYRAQMLALIWRRHPEDKANVEHSPLADQDDNGGADGRQSPAVGFPPG